MKLGDLRKLAQSFPEQPAPNMQAQLADQIRALGLNPDALYQELEMTSRFVDTHRDISFSNAQMQLHSHAFYELIYCRNNCGAEYLIGPEHYRLQRGDIVFVPPGISHRPLLPEHPSEPYERYVLWMSTDFMALYNQLSPNAFSDKHGTAGLLRANDSNRELLGELFRTGVQEAERQAEGWESAVLGNTIMLLTQIRRTTKEHSARFTEAEQPELLDRLAAYVEKHYTDSITLADLAKRFFVSSSTVSHLFKQKLGVSFYRYVTQRRLIAAKVRIEEGMLLEDVATACGFQDYSGFYRAFKQVYGISPRQYRNLQNPGGTAHR